MKIPIFPGKYHQNGGFSWAMLVYRRVVSGSDCTISGESTGAQISMGFDQNLRLHGPVFAGAS